MRSDRLLAKDLPRELQAALLGDFKVLRSGSSDAQHFAMAFSSEAGQRWWEETPPAGPLSLVAKAISCERRGESAEAINLYEKAMRESTTPWMRVMGLLAQGWSLLIEDMAPILEAADQIRELRRSPRKARLLAKLSVFATDKGDIEVGRALWQEAINSSDEQTQLGRALRVEGFNLNLGPIGTELLRAPAGEEVDDLVHPEAIDQMRLDSANSTLEQAVEDQFGGPWRYTIRMGLTPLGRLDTAEAQARWIGLPWLRRQIRKQMGAQLLAGAAQDPDQWTHGVVAWALGGGRSVQMAMRLAEPHFGYESGDYIINTVSTCDPTRGRSQRLAALGAEAWDLVSDEALQQLTEQVPPQQGEGSPAPESRMIWAGFAIRLTDLWYERYRRFDSSLQGTLLDSLNPVALRYFNAEMKVTMYEALGSDEEVLADGGRLLPLAAALAPAGDDERLRHLLDSQPILTRVVAQLKEERPSVVSPTAESRVLDHLRGALAEQSANAREGSIALGGAGPRLELGRMLSVVQSPDQELVDLLVETAVDPSLPPQYLVEARQGLVLLRRKKGLRQTDVRRLRSAPPIVGQGPFREGFTSGVLRVLLLQILADRTTEAERAELVAAVRSTEVRVRDIAVNTCAEALQTRQDEGLAWAVVSGLFDPADSVSDGALAGLQPLTEHFKTAAEVAWQRLPDLFNSSARDVRSQIIHALEHVSPKTNRQKERQRALLARAHQDRSWQVRNAAAEIADAK